MNKQNKFMSLRNKLFIVLAISLVCSAFVFFIVREAGNFLVWRYYLNEKNKQERVEGYIEDFQQYVYDNTLSINDSDRISQWSAGRYVDIVLYKDSNLIYAPDWFEQIDKENVSGSDTGETDLETSTETVETDSEGDSITDNADGSFADSKYSSEIGGWFSGDRGFEQYLNEEAREKYQTALNRLLEGNRSLHPVYFVDGTLLITVVDYTEEFVYNLVYAISLVSAFLVIAVLMIIGFTHTASRLNRLAQKVQTVESGNLELPITVEGNDEISALANDVNSMRNAVIDNMTKERQAWEANAELITAMSHDIRTPLTVLLGYLDLMELQDGEDISEYISACKENAMRLKRLSDDMFSYFLVFGRREVNIDVSEKISGDALEHMIAERRLWLSEAGFDLVCKNNASNVIVNIDVAYFGRVLDNIFSNLKKYAEPRERICIDISTDEAMLTLSVKNVIREDEEIAESNGIGNKTCVRIMELMGGSFEAVTDESDYVVTLKLPIKRAE